MAQLKEIKNRIQSVRSTQKITSAMMMISSARLVKTQRLIQSLYPYEQSLYRMLQLLAAGREESIDSPFLQTRAVKRVAIVAFSSNTGLAGRFNDDIAEKLKKVVANYMPLGKENILLYPIGEKVAKAVRSMGFKPQGDYSAISESPFYHNAQQIAGKLMEMYQKGEIDHVELIYHHFLTKGSQVIINEPFLPIEPKIPDGEKSAPNYIVEPDRRTILTQLIPKILKVKFYTAHLDSVTSEHAARMTAMRIATDNADDLSEELTLEYNKLRQQSITNELLDIVGGSFGNA
ncbi:ATP synthase gamma chain [Proteiniphilum saccharofermentans]|uniref:ATP synthase gamma chain n=1 Tax=Proteiniphilum saccharofermentans TaxID=1642647 RepID=A0A1R3SVC5_9BACT|nr:ATP synthase F1 subunit gamma [Proteiniphilum saccharofermentans]SCD20273.1 ATP synthase gamma chain [Proteiniphilum saccharofermentans]